MDSTNQYQAIVDTYGKNHSIKQIASEAGVSVTKVRRVLITEGLWSSRSSKKVGELHAQGLSVREIAEKLKITEKAVESYLPYSKGAYGGDSRSNSALRSEAYRERNMATAERQVSTPTDREKLMERGNTAQQINEQSENDEDRKARAILLRLELNTDLFNAKDRSILKRYGRADLGITRDIIVPANITLHALHYAIQRAFGWQNAHSHNFRIPEERFKALVGDDMMFIGWKPLCGLYFRSATEDTRDLYWDDDYEGETSIKSWMRQKYTGPYYYGGFVEHYMECQMTIKWFCQTNPEIVIPKAFEEWENSAEQPETVTSMGRRCVTPDRMTITEFGRVTESDPRELLERLSLKELIEPRGMVLSKEDRVAIEHKVRSQQAVFEKEAETLRCHQRNIMNVCDLIERGENKGYKKYNEALAHYNQFISQTEIDVIPITDTLLYEYDYGDNWEVKVTCEEIYSVEMGHEHPDLKGYWVYPITAEQVINDLRAYDRQGRRIEGILRDQIAKVVAKQRPLCIAADGLCVMDNVGGIGGYCDFLETIHEADDEDAEEMKDWARSMGWTGRKVSPENLL